MMSHCGHRLLLRVASPCRPQDHVLSRHVRPGQARCRRPIWVVRAGDGTYGRSCGQRRQQGHAAPRSGRRARAGAGQRWKTRSSTPPGTNSGRPATPGSPWKGSPSGPEPAGRSSPVGGRPGISSSPPCAATVPCSRERSPTLGAFPPRVAALPFDLLRSTLLLSPGDSRAITEIVDQVFLPLVSR